MHNTAPPHLFSPCLPPPAPPPHSITRNYGGTMCWYGQQREEGGSAFSLISVRAASLCLLAAIGSFFFFPRFLGLFVCLFASKMFLLSTRPVFWFFNANAAPIPTPTPLSSQQDISLKACLLPFGRWSISVKISRISACSTTVCQEQSACQKAPN